MGTTTGRVAGLVVLAGRTGSGKTTFAEALTLEYLNHCFTQDSRSNERPPHIVTFEDPIETRFAKTPYQAQRHGFDYTPRQKGIDALSLTEALNDALRQTPALFYVGEVRRANAWRALLHFAGTGHLVVTTTHSASLVETMAAILRATGAQTPAERSEVGGLIAALIHFRTYDHATGKGRTTEKLFVPALWRRTPHSVNALTAEGLGSILPHRIGNDKRSPGTFGRAYFANKVPHLRPFSDLLNQALVWDLSGE